jgi:hypothetical protein
MSDTSNAIVPRQSTAAAESNGSNGSNAVVPKVRGADVVEVDDSAPNLGSAITRLQDVLASMKPDDFSLEYEQDRVRTRFRLRAYKHRSDGRS